MLHTPALLLLSGSVQSVTVSLSMWKGIVSCAGTPLLLGDEFSLLLFTKLTIVLNKCIQLHVL